MSSFDPAAYGPVFESLLTIDRCRALDHGSPDSSVKRQLHEMTRATAFAHAKIADHDMAGCCLAGVWLLHDFLDESHNISQGIDATNGSFWHGVMHRREGDFSNAKYWFRRVGDHEAFAAIGERAQQAAEDLGDSEVSRIASRVVQHGALDPSAFVDACQSARRTGGAGEQFCRLVQQAEWEELFDFCYRHALGG